MEAEILAVKFLGIALIVLIVGIVLCFLASLGYNTYIKYHNKGKKIEVRTRNSNSNQNELDKGWPTLVFINYIILIFS